MNPVYEDIIERVLNMFSDLTPAQKSRFGNTPDKFLLLRGIFYSIRGSGDPRGMRLSRMGHDILRTLYRSHEINLQGRGVTSRDLIYLDIRSRLPYYIRPKALILYDADLALTLMMADGDLSILADLDPAVRE